MKRMTSNLTISSIYVCGVFYHTLANVLLNRSVHHPYVHIDVGMTFVL